MTMYEIGFYYPIITYGYQSTHKRFIVVYRKNHFEFLTTDKQVLPDFLEKNGKSYSISEPLLIESVSNKIVHIIPLGKINRIKYGEQLTNSGFELIDPNPYGGMAEYSLLVEYPKGELYCDGKPLFDSSYFRKSGEYANYQYEVCIESIDYYCTSRILHEIKNDCSTRMVYKIGSWKDYRSWEVIINEKLQYLDSLDIQGIVDTIQIKIDEHFRNKIGGDDSYTVHKYVSVAREYEELVKNDCYLKTLLEYGVKELVKETGYTSAYTLKLLSEYDGYLGNFTEDMLNNEKQRILSRYSVAEHMGYLLAEFSYEIDIKREFDIPKWESRLDRIGKKLFRKFRLGEIYKYDSRKLQNLECKTDQEIESALSEINKELGKITFVDYRL